MELNLSELPPVLGISKAMLFAYRKGSRRITSKAWRKLEAAEEREGIAAEPAQPPRAVTADEQVIAAALLLGDFSNILWNIQERRLDAAVRRARDFFSYVTFLAEWAARADQITDQETVGELKTASASVLKNAPMFSKIHEELFRHGMAMLAATDTPPAESSPPVRKG